MFEEMILVVPSSSILSFPRDQKDAKFLSCALEPAPDIFERYLKGESDSVTDFCLKQLAHQIPIENAGGELSNSRDEGFINTNLLNEQPPCQNLNH